MIRKISTWTLTLGIVLMFSISSALADEIDFEGLPPGTIVNELSKGQGITGNINGVVKVLGHNTIFPTTNAAIIFDSSCTPTSLSICEEFDLDLGTPHMDFGGPGIGDGGAAGGPYPNDTPLGNILVLAKDLIDSNFDGLVDDPDDADLPGYINFDFSGIKKGKSDGTVTINSFTIQDVELAEGETPAQVELSGPGILTATIAVNNLDNGGVLTYDGINLSGVSNMRVNLKGSSAFASVLFNERREGICWITTGGFNNASITDPDKKDFTFGGNVGPPPSGSWQVVDHNTGDKYHTNDVHITLCEEIPGTGPGQPGGKKGFTINKAYFEGIGRLNHVPGYPVTGFVIDRGEPSGKNGNDTDEIQFIIYDPDTSLPIIEWTGLLTGGNVQIHPPTGKPLP